MTTPQTTPELLPCPFCGHDKPSFERTGTGRHSCIVACGNCGARHESSDEYERSGESWNTRARVTAAPLEGVSGITRIQMDGDAYLEQSGPRSIWGLYCSGELIRYLHTYECQFVEAALATPQPPAAQPFRVSVNPMQAANGVTYVVCLSSPSRPLDAKPWDSGMITPINRNNVEEANHEGERWAEFLGAEFTPCEAVEGKLPNTQPEYGAVFREAVSQQSEHGGQVAENGSEPEDSMLRYCDKNIAACIEKGNAENLEWWQNWRSEVIRRAALTQSEATPAPVVRPEPTAFLVRDAACGSSRDFSTYYDADQFYIANRSRMLAPQFLFCYANPIPAALKPAEAVQAVEGRIRTIKIEDCELTEFDSDLPDGEYRISLVATPPEQTGGGK